MLEKIFNKNKKPDIKTIAFYKFAYNIGAVSTESIDEIKIETLLLDSFLFLIKKRVVTQKEENNILVFKDRYNQYLEYCLEKKLIKEDTFMKADQLYLTTIPDMSKIEVSDVSKELKEMSFDLDNISKVFSGLSSK